MPRFKLTIEYAGTRYSGWQIQKNAKTVQGEIDRAVRTVTGRKDFELYGSGRTDAGVHALAQVAHLDVSTPPAAETLRRRLNDELPADINILDGGAGAAPLPRAPRRGRAPLPLSDRAAPDGVRQGVRLVGEGAARRRADARGGAARSSACATSGRSPPRTRATTTRRRRRRWCSSIGSTIVEDGDLVLVSIEGSHFLWKMVRRIVGVLVEIGTRRDAGPTRSARSSPDGSTAPARLTAPPSGLFLETVLLRRATRKATPPRAATPLLAPRSSPDYERRPSASSTACPFDARAEHQAHDLVVAGRPGLDAVRLQIRVVHAPAGARDAAGSPRARSGRGSRADRRAARRERAPTAMRDPVR